MADGDSTDAGLPGPEPAAGAERPRRADRTDPGGVRPGTPVVVATVYLLVCYAAIVVVDVYGVGLDSVREALPARPAVWLLLFEEGSPTELLQWGALGTLAVLSGSLAARLRLAGNGHAAAFWLLVAVAAVLMLMEDAGNVRHRLSFWAMAAGLFEDWRWRALVEALWYAAIASVFAWAVVRHGPAADLPRATVGYGVAGVVAYALAAIGSVTRDFHWYVRLGRFVEERLLRTELLVPPDWHRVDVQFFLADHVVEESLELLGAAFLLAAALAYRRRLPQPLTASDRE
jgi:hypothetical protein